MGIIDVPGPPARTAADGAKDVKRYLRQAVNQVDQSLANIRNVANEFGRSALGTELGPDGAALLRVYNALKDVLESAEVGKTVDPLP